MFPNAIHAARDDPCRAPYYVDKATPQQPIETKPRLSNV